MGEWKLVEKKSAAQPKKPKFMKLKDIPRSKTWEEMKLEAEGKSLILQKEYNLGEEEKEEALKSVPEADLPKGNNSSNSKFNLEEWMNEGESNLIKLPQKRDGPTASAAPDSDSESGSDTEMDKELLQKALIYLEQKEQLRNPANIRHTTQIIQDKVQNDKIGTDIIQKNTFNQVMHMIYNFRTRK